MKNKNTLIFTISIVSLIVISFISLIFGSKILNITDIFDVIFNYSTSKYSFIIFEYRVQLACDTGVTTISSILTWGGCVTAQRMVRAMSSPRSGRMPSYTLSAFSLSPWKRISENSVSTLPGRISVTLTPVPSRSMRMPRLRACTACFVAQ